MLMKCPNCNTKFERHGNESPDARRICPVCLSNNCAPVYEGPIPETPELLATEKRALLMDVLGRLEKCKGPGTTSRAACDVVAWDLVQEALVEMSREDGGRSPSKYLLEDWKIGGDGEKTSRLQVQITAQIETPCCHETVILARNFPGAHAEYPIKWAGVACPGCQRTFAIELEPTA